MVICLTTRDFQNTDQYGGGESVYISICYLCLHDQWKIWLACLQAYHPVWLTD
jgi:hypothetical protein